MCSDSSRVKCIRSERLKWKKVICPKFYVNKDTAIFFLFKERD